MAAVNGAVVLLIVAWVVALVVEAIIATPSWDEVK